MLDSYVYLTKLGGRLDMEYIEGECEKLGIAGFERQSRSLAMNLFGAEKLTDEDKENAKIHSFQRYIRDD